MILLSVLVPHWVIKKGQVKDHLCLMKGNLNLHVYILTCSLHKQKALLGINWPSFHIPPLHIWLWPYIALKAILYLIWRLVNNFCLATGRCGGYIYLTRLAVHYSTHRWRYCCFLTRSHKQNYWIGFIGKQHGATALCCYHLVTLDISYLVSLH